MLKDTIKTFIKGDVLTFTLIKGVHYIDYEDVINILSLFTEKFTIKVIRTDKIFEIPYNWNKGFKVKILTEILVILERKNEINITT